MKRTLLLSGLIMLLAHACAEITLPEGHVHQDVDGFISIEAENHNTIRGWEPRTYYTSLGITPKSDSLSGNYVEYKLVVKRSGEYKLHVLGNRRRNEAPSDNFFSISLFDGDHLLAKHGMLFPDGMNATVWSSISEADGNAVKLRFPGRGLYTLRIQNELGHGYYLDKLVLSKDPAYRPSGMGPTETLATARPLETNNEIVLPPRWAFGVIYGGYTNQEQTLATVEKLIDGGYPIDAYWIDSYFWDFDAGKGPGGYIDFVGDTVAYPDVKAMWDRFNLLSVRAGFWIWDVILETGNEAVFDDFQDRGFFRGTYINRGGWHNSTKNTLTGIIDFENPDAVAYWKQQLKPFFDAGLDFVKLDNSSAIPFTKAAFEATQEMGKNTKGRGFVLAHLHSTYDSRYKLYPTKWTGDAKIAWNQPDYPNLGNYSMGAFKENIGMVADPKRTTYDIPFLTHDAGGYDYFGSTEQSDELYIRWIQFSAMNAMMTIFSAARNETRNHPYGYSQEAQDNFRKYTHLRMRLFPYIYSYAMNTRITGQKMVQGDGIHEYQYLFGQEILVAPVFEQGGREQTVYLPEGEWIEFETGVIYSGNQYVTVEAPLSTLPMFVRSGAIIPMRNYARTIELGSNDSLTLRVYPATHKSEFILHEDDGLSEDYRAGGFASTNFSLQQKNKEITMVIKPVKGSYHGMKPSRVYHIEFHVSDEPLSVQVNGNDIDQGNIKTGMQTWLYDASARIIHVVFDAEKLVETSVNVRMQ